MANKLLPKAGPVTDNTLYCDGKLVAREFKISLPSVVATTASIGSMGPIEIPIRGYYENMECTVTLTGDDAISPAMLSPKWHDLEVRAVQSVIDTSGNELRKQVKYRLRAYPKEIPNGDMEPGTATERSIVYTVAKVQKYFDGNEQYCLDRINHVHRINGVDWQVSDEKLL